MNADMPADEVFEELEEIAEVEEAGTGLPDLPAGDDEPPPETPRCSAVFALSPFPVLTFDADLRIACANRASADLFKDRGPLEGSYFSDAFGKALGAEALKDLREGLKSRERGHAWKGSLGLKSREAGTLLAKAYVFPADEADPPRWFAAFFDDVTEENRDLLHKVFLSLLEASKLKDNDTGKHIDRVNVYAARFAEALFGREGYAEVDRDFIEDIGFLASMHDVGKIGTPDDILNKEGALEDWEWAVMREHTKNGAYLLSTYPNPMARAIALHHHERWDGSGYPYGIEGTMIPLAARIVSVCDVYDALRMRRSYKAAFSHAEAIAKILEWRGTHFDPRLLDVFSEIAGDFERIYAENSD